MAEEESFEVFDLQDEPWEDRSLNLLHASKINKYSAKLKANKKRRKKHKLQLMKRPMEIPEVILELQDQSSREIALRCLSIFLLEKRDEDPENYSRTAYLLYHSCSTMTILLQEVLAFSQLMARESVTVRSSKRLMNVLTLFQCIASNEETREKFVESFVPNFLIPVILFESQLEIFENVRVVALSVVAILCQAKEPRIILWALESHMVEVCRTSMEVATELSKVIAMHILESILKSDTGIRHICHPRCNHLLKGLMNTLEHLVNSLALDQDASPRVLFHIVRCYVLLCTTNRGLHTVRERLPSYIVCGAFDGIAEELPLMKSLLQHLLLIVGKNS